MDPESEMDISEPDPKFHITSDSETKFFSDPKLSWILSPLSPQVLHSGGPIGPREGVYPTKVDPYLPGSYWYLLMFFFSSKRQSVYGHRIGPIRF